MKNWDKKDLEVVVWILIAIILFVLYGWHKSEDNRLKLLEEFNEAKDTYEYQISLLEEELEEYR